MNYLYGVLLCVAFVAGFFTALHVRLLAIREDLKELAASRAASRSFQETEQILAAQRDEKAAMLAELEAASAASDNTPFGKPPPLPEETRKAKKSRLMPWIR